MLWPQVGYDNKKSAAAFGGFVQNESSPHLKSRSSPCDLTD